MNSILSIVIPTFNRAPSLDESLRRHLSIVSRYNISIYISDNASTDGTRSVVEQHQQKYSNLFYHVNTENMGPDCNFEIGLLLPESQFVWLLGDTSSFDEHAVHQIAQRLHTDPELDLLVINDAGRVHDVPTTTFTDINTLLQALGWHMTQVSSLIYSRKLIHQAHFERYRNTSFIQTGIVFEYLAYLDRCSIGWLQDVDVVGFKVDGFKKVGWFRETFDIWLHRWPNIVMSLPTAYTLESKQIAIRLHNARARVFSISKIMRLRAHGVLTVRVALQYLPVAQQSISTLTIIMMLFLSIIPRWVFKFKK